MKPGISRMALLWGAMGCIIAAAILLGMLTW